MSLLLDGLKDPRVKSTMTSIVDVNVTPDLKYCKVFVSVLGNDEEKQATLQGLRSSASYLRRELAHIVNLRNTPELIFVLDDSIEYGMHISELIKKIHEKEDQHEAEDDSREDSE